MSTWPVVTEKLDSLWIYIGFVVLTVGMAVWFALATKGVKDEVKTIAEAE